VSIHVPLRHLTGQAPPGRGTVVPFCTLTLPTQPQLTFAGTYDPAMDTDPDHAEVKASGGVVWRRGDRGLEVALVHRPKYDDWSFPKGKLDEGESWEEAALREVEEEVGLKCRLGHELPSTAYRDPKGRQKVVRYRLMEPLGGEFEPNHEVDEMRWLPAAEAADLLTYEHDRELLREVTG
jgi:8-oxo-dGTP diphosphatase